jgi:hypothetical protein
MARGEARRGRGFWLTAGEIVGVLALIIAGLNLWDSHRQHVEDARRAAREETSQQAQAAFVATGVADREGARIAISPLKASQAIQSEAYLFPAAVLAAPQDISAAKPRIELAWVAPGLRSALASAGIKGSGHGYMSVVITTAYVEDGDERSDVSLYRIGYAWKPRLFGGEQIRLEGLALIRRGVSANPKSLLDARWQAERPRHAG